MRTQRQGTRDAATPQQGGTAAEYAQIYADRPLLERGDRGSEVAELQRQLAAAGYASGAADGSFGPRTEAALLAFQRANGVFDSGKAGPDTWGALAVARPPEPGYLDDWAQEQDAREQAPTTSEVDNEPGWMTEGSGTMRHAPFSIDAGAYERFGLRKGVLQKSLDAYDIAWRNRETRKPIFTIVDYEIRSTEKRLFTIDLSTGSLINHEFMAHGIGSGEGGRKADGSPASNETYWESNQFSNRSGSNQSSLGMMRTGETYHGQFGYAMRLDGLERGINDNVRNRTIVMHGQEGVADADDSDGREATLTRGCLGLDPAVTERVIDSISGGTMIFSYYPSQDYAERSEYVRR